MTDADWHSRARTVAVVAMTLALVLWAPAVAMGPAIGTAAAQEGDPPQTPAAYFGNVTIDGEPAPAGTVIEAVVDGRVAGSITIEEAGEYGGPDALDDKLTVGGNQSIPDDSAVTFYVDNDEIDRTEVTSTEPKTVIWESGDVREVDLRTSVGAPLFEVGIDNAPGSVNASENIDVTLNISNTGVAAGERRVNVSVDGEVRGRTTEELDSGETTQSLVSVPTDLDDVGDVTVTADSGDDTASTTVTVVEPADFAVDLAVDNETVNATEYVNGTATVTNEGNRTDTQNLTVTVGDTEVNDTELTLAPDENRAIDFSYETSAADVGTRVVTAATDDDSNASLVTVNAQATFAVNVIESESNLDVVAGENATIVAEIENTGGSTGTKTVTVTREDTELTSEDLTLAPGEIADISAENETDTDRTDDFNLTVATPDDSETELVNVTEAQDASFDVTIDDAPDSVDEPLPGNTTNISVDVTVDNLGGQQGTQTINFSVNGDSEPRANIADLQLASGGTDTQTVDVPVYPGETPSVDLSVASDNDTVTRTVEVNSTAEFDVSIVDRSNESELDTETPFAPTINVTNVGDQTGNGTLTVLFNNSTAGTFAVDELPGGETRTIVEPNNGFALNASDDGIKLLEASIGNNATDAVDDVSTRPVAIGAAPNFTVEGVTLSPSGPIDQSGTLTVTATINNTGDTAGTNQTIAIEFDDTEIGATVVDELGPGNETTVSADYSPRAADVGSQTVTVSTDEDTETRSIRVLEDAEFRVRDVDAADSVIAGQSAAVTVTVQNVGGLAGNKSDVRLFADGSEVATRTLTLDAEQTRLVTFDGSDAVPTTDAGELDVTAVTEDSLGTDTVSVGEPGELDLELISLTDPVTNESTLSATVRATNVGDGPATETVALRLDGRIVDNTTVTAAGGESTTVGLSHPIDRTLDGESTEASVSIGAADDTIDETVVIERPPESPDFRVSDLNAPASVLDVEETVNVTASVANVGDQEGTQDIELLVDESVRDTNASLTLAGSETATVDLSFNASNVSTGDVSYSIESTNQSTGGTITVEEAEPGTAEITATQLGSATQEESFEVDATVENTGDLNATNETITLDYVAATGSNDSVEIDSLEPGATTTVTLAVTPPPEPRAGAFDREIEVRSNDSTVTRTVAVDFGDIQSGVAAAEAGEAVLIASGTYEERNAITIDTDGIRLAAAGSGSAPVIESPRQDDTGLEVTAADVEVSNLRFDGDGNGTAVVLDGDNTTVRNLRVRNWETGIAEDNGTNRIVGASVVSAGTGIVLDGDGDTRVEFARVARAETQGIRVASSENTLLGVGVFAAKIGVDISGADAQDNRIEQSIVRGNDDIGVRVADVPPGEYDIADPTPPSAYINNSALESNGVEARIVNSTVNASQNWWGTAVPTRNVEYVVRSGLALDPANTRPASQFNVDIGASLGGETVRGEEVTVTAAVSNDGTKVDLQTVELLADGTVVDSTDVQLSGDSEQDVTLRYTPDLSDGDDIDFTVRSLDDSASQTVDVLEPAFFDVPSLSVSTEVTAGETLEVTPTVENTGEAEVEQTVRLLIDGTEVDTAAVTLSDATPTGTPTLTYVPTDGDVGTINVTVVTDDATRSAFVTVLEAEETTDPPGSGPGPGSDDDDDDLAPDLGADITPIATETVTPSFDGDLGRQVATFETVESVQSVALDTTESVGDVSVSQVDPADSPVGDAPGTAVTLQDISVPDEATNTAGVIQFRVSASAVSTAPENLRVFRFTEGDWQRLETRVVGETDETIVVEADTPGFSYFAVSEVQEPEAALAFDPAPAEVGQEITLSGSESTDPDGEIVSYEWTVDGASYTGETVSVSFDEPGEYEVELSVTDDSGETSTATETLSVGAAQATTEPEPDTATPEPETETTEGPTQEPGGFDLVLVIAVLLLLAAGYVAYRRT